MLASSASWGIWKLWSVKFVGLELPRRMDNGTVTHRGRQNPEVGKTPRHENAGSQAHCETGKSIHWVTPRNENSQNVTCGGGRENEKLAEDFYLIYHSRDCTKNGTQVYVSACVIAAIYSYIDVLP